MAGYTNDKKYFINILRPSKMRKKKKYVFK